MSGIFISYRRSDSAGHTGRLADDLGEKLVGQALFRDIEAIEAGEDFVEALARAVGECAVMLVVIGPTWAKVTANDGQRRLHQAGDFVRMEVEAALARNVRVIPVLVGDAQIPNPEDLPESMAPLLRRNAYSISDRRWQYDIDRLLEILVRIPGVTGHKPDSVAAAAPPVESIPLSRMPAARAALPTWAKIALAVVGVLFALGVISSFMPDPSADEPSTAGAPTTQGAPIAPEDDDVAAAVEGLWVIENGFYYGFTRDGDDLLVFSGESIDPTKDQAGAAGGMDYKGAELRGEVAVDGRRLQVTLIDSFSGDTELLQVEVSPDGNTMQGQLDGTPVTLKRP